jgi:hypothetical protein
MKGKHRMRFTKTFIMMSLILAVGLFGCTPENKAAAPTQEEVIKDLVPPKAEVKGTAFLIELSDLKVVMNVNIASKEVVDTPTLKGKIKITNKSKDILDMKEISLEYLNETGRPIPYKADEKISNIIPRQKVLQPGEFSEESFDATLPLNAIKEKSLRKIDVSLVYIASPLKREKLSLSGKVE